MENNDGERYDARGQNLIGCVNNVSMRETQDI